MEKVIRIFERQHVFFQDFLAFGIKQALACVFAGAFLITLVLSHHVTLGLFRYDFIFVMALLIQCILYKTGLETGDEVKVIFLFHFIGIVLELFKTHPNIGSWSYPEQGWFKIGNVPLYSGFMYAAVASYMVQSWRLMSYRIEGYPPVWLTYLLCFAIYGNFFAHHHPLIPDIRWWLIGLTLLLFFKTRIYFTPLKREYYIPLWLGFVLVGFFVWIAENLATFWGAWTYPDQQRYWVIVSWGKITSWSLLVIFSAIIVMNLKDIKRNIHH